MIFYVRTACGPAGTAVVADHPAEGHLMRMRLIASLSEGGQGGTVGFGWIFLGVAGKMAKFAV